MGFVEVKAPGQRARQLQVARHRRLAELGCYVAVLDDPTEVDAILDEIEQHTAATPKAAEGHAATRYRAAEGYEHQNTVKGAAEGYEHQNIAEEGSDKHAGSG